MGGAAPEPTGKGGKKVLDAYINLVPYIDLLMTIMTFLMMTAVWTQIAMLEVQNASGGQEAQPEDEDKDKPKPILVLVTDRGVKIQEEQNPDLREFAANADGYDFNGVKIELKRLKDARPDRTEVKIQSEDGVKYTHLVQLIDIATGLDMKALTLTPTAQ
ncbi:MAG: biopolymer transporter ExbD [Deltaproteobacteria bacterium]|nr:biopolymer transporter ExbD [Deltaproteobacteria bacterium]